MAVWGQKLDELTYERFNQVGDRGHLRMMLELLLPWLPPPFDPFFLRVHRKFYGRFDSFVNPVWTTPDPLHSRLLDTAKIQGTALSETDFRNALVNVFYGGVYSVSSTLASAFYLLDQNPTVAAELRQQLTETIQQKPDYQLADLESWSLLDYTIRETMRFYAPVPLYFRNSRTDQPIKLKYVLEEKEQEREFPPNTMFFISNWYLQRSEKHCSDPEQFRPHRWANGAAVNHSFGSDFFFPFGRGPRQCVGQYFALFYMKLALATLLTQTKVTFDPAKQPYQQLFYFGVMMPKKLKCRFQAN